MWVEIHAWLWKWADPSAQRSMFFWFKAVRERGKGTKGCHCARVCDRDVRLYCLLSACSTAVIQRGLMPGEQRGMVQVRQFSDARLFLYVDCNNILS